MRKYIFLFGIFSLFAFGITTGFPVAEAIESGIIPGENNTFAPPNQDDVPNELNNDDFREQVLTIVNYFLGFVGLISVVALVFFGFLWITAGGNDDQVERGKKGIIWVALGILLILLSWVIVSFLVNATADAASSSPLHEDEQKVRDRIETLFQSMDTTRITFSLAEEWKNSYENLFSELPNSETVRILEEAFETGKMKNADEEIQEAFEKMSEIAQDFENIDISLEDVRNQQRALQTQFDTLRSTVRDRLRTLTREIEDLPRMVAKIETEPREGSLPLTVRMSGLTSEDPSHTTIPAQNYEWSFVDASGTEQNLGSGPVKTMDFTELGSYVMRLEVSTASGEDILPGVATTTIRVFPEETTARFTINGEDPTSIFKISLQEAKSGIIFDPTSSTIADGAVASEYVWNFGGDKEVQHFPIPVTHFFSETGEKRVSLNISTNTEERGKTKEVLIQILPSLAIIDFSRESPEVGQVVEMSGARSSLEEGVTPEYRWRISTTEGILIFEETGKSRIAYTFSDPGEYSVELLLGNDIRAERTISVSSQSPVASFVGETISSVDPALFRFDASSSFDPEGEALRYYWDFDNDGKFDVRNSQSSQETYRFPQSGTKVVRLEVVDVTGKTGNVQQSFAIRSTLSAHFSPSQSVAAPQEHILFSATEKNAHTYSWNFGDGITEETGSSEISHEYISPGTYNVTLTVRDSVGNTNMFQESVAIGGSDAPVVMAKVQREGWSIVPEGDLCEGHVAFRVRRNEKITLVGESTLGTDSNTAYTWTFSDRESAKGKEIVKTFSALSKSGGCEQVTLSVINSTTGASVVSNPLFFFVENIPPRASALEVRTSGGQCITPCLVSLSVRGDSDPDGKIVQYRWWAVLEGDTEALQMHTTKTPSTQLLLPTMGAENQERTFFLFAEVEDNDGDVFELEKKSITVKNGTSDDFSVDFFPNKTAVLSGEFVRFTAEVHDTSGENDYRFFWDFTGDGLDDDTTSGSEAMFAFSEPGTYIVRLRVESKGSIRFAERNIFVEDRTAFLPEYHSPERFLFVTPFLSANTLYASLQLAALSDAEDHNLFTIYIFGRNIDGTLAEGNFTLENEGAEILSSESTLKQGVAVLRIRITAENASLHVHLPLSVGTLTETLSLPFSSL